MNNIDESTYKSKFKVNWEVPEPIKIDNRKCYIEQAYHDCLLVATENVTRSIPFDTLTGRNVEYQQSGEETPSHYKVVYCTVADPDKGGGGYLLAPLDNEKSEAIFVDVNDAKNIVFKFAGGKEFNIDVTGFREILLKPIEEKLSYEVKFEPGMEFQAYLKGSELDGVAKVKVGQNNALTAVTRDANGKTIEKPIEHSDIVPTNILVHDHLLNKDIHVNAQKLAKAVAMASHSNAFETSQETGVKIDMSSGKEIVDKLCERIDKLDKTSDIIILQYRFDKENGGRVLDALCQHKEKFPESQIRVVASDADNVHMKANLADMGIKLIVPDFATSKSKGFLNHSKGASFANEDGVTGYLATLNPVAASENKMDFLAELSPQGAKYYKEYIEAAFIEGNAKKAQTLLPTMAREGVLFNDPANNIYAIPAKNHEIIKNAHESLVIFSKEVAETPIVDTVIQKVEEGVQVEIYYRKLAESVREKLEQCAKTHDNLILKSTSELPYKHHGNAIVADNTIGISGTSYLSEYMTVPVTGTRNADNAVVVTGEQARHLQEKIWSQMNPEKVAELDALRGTIQTAIQNSNFSASSNVASSSVKKSNQISH